MRLFSRPLEEEDSHTIGLGRAHYRVSSMRMRIEEYKKRCGRGLLYAYIILTLNPRSTQLKTVDRDL
jgi:hypothetical protein